jgi:hypothetical protein
MVIPATVVVNEKVFVPVPESAVRALDDATRPRVVTI